MCSMTFTTNGNMNRHKHTHSEEEKKNVILKSPGGADTTPPPTKKQKLDTNEVTCLTESCVETSTLSLLALGQQSITCGARFASRPEYEHHNKWQHLSDTFISSYENQDENARDTGVLPDELPQEDFLKSFGLRPKRPSEQVRY